MKLLPHIFLLLFTSCHQLQTAENAEVGIEIDDFRVIMQPNAQYCGPACLKMVTDHLLYRRHSLEKIAKLCKTDEIEGTNAYNLTKAAEDLGLRSLVIKIDYKTLLKDVPLPCIAHWQGNHFVVIYNISKDSVWVADPSIGKKAYNKETFCEFWQQSDVDSMSSEKEGIAIAFEKNK
jgi:ATP-binding cassette subfamily B protein